MHSTVTIITEKQEDIGSPDMAVGAQRSRKSYGRHDPDSDSRVDRAGFRKIKRFPVGRTGNRFLQNHPGANRTKPTPLRVQRIICLISFL